MRKDSRIGMTIGGVLVAVLIVYAVVVPKSNKKKVTLDTTGQQAAPVGETSAGGGAPPDSADPSSANPPAEKPADSASAGNSGQPTPVPTGDRDTSGDAGKPEAADPPSKGSGANWAALLASDHVDVSTLRTQTPGLARHDDAASSTGDPISGKSGSPRTLVDPPLEPVHSSQPSTSRNAGSSATTHRVAQGETFSSIADTYYGSSRYATKLAKANPNIDPRRLRPGMMIHLPDKAQIAGGDASSDSATASTGTTKRPSHGLVKIASNSTREYVVQSNDSLYRISKKLYGSGEQTNALYEMNKELIGPNAHNLKVGMVLKLPQPPTAGSAVR